MNKKLAVQKFGQILYDNHNKEIANDYLLLKLTENQTEVNRIVKKYNLDKK